MKKSKVIIEWSILDKIAKSNILSPEEKLTFLKYVAYMTTDEKRELATLI